MRKRQKSLVWPGRRVLLLLVVFVSLANIEPILYKNLAYVSFGQALASDHISAMERQEKLMHFLKYLRLVRDQEISLPDAQDSAEKTMLQAIFIGEYHRFQGDVDEAAHWYLQAVESDPFPLWQDSLSYMLRNGLLPDGNILIDDFSDMRGWVPDSHNNAVDARFERIDRVTSISYRNLPAQRDLLAYSLYPNPLEMPLAHHAVLSIRVKLELGSYLTLEEVTLSNGRTRHLNYYRGTGEWETLKFSITGDILGEIKLIVSEPNEPREANIYRVWIDSIKLECGE